MSPTPRKASERGDAHHPVCVFLEPSVSADGAGLEEAAAFRVPVDAVLNTSVTTGRPGGLTETLGAPELPPGAESGVELGGGRGCGTEMILSWRSLESQTPAPAEPKAP